MRASSDKCHLLVTTNALTSVNINGFIITNRTKERLLSIKFYSKLYFKNHVSSLYKKASQKMHALTRIVNYINFFDWKPLMKTFVIFQLDCCPLVWIFDSRKLNHRINSIHERVLRVTYQDYKSTFSLATTKKWLCNNSSEEFTSSCYWNV